MKDAKYANDIARKENDTALEAVKKRARLGSLLSPPETGIRPYLTDLLSPA
jgi:hypothetical protein